jgi:hypothetical protein
VLARQTTQLTGNTRPPRKWFNSAPRNLDAPVVEPALVGPRPATPQTTHCPTTGELSAARDRQTPLHGEPAVTATPKAPVPAFCSLLIVVGFPDLGLLRSLRYALGHQLAVGLPATALEER